MLAATESIRGHGFQASEGPCLFGHMSCAQESPGSIWWTPDIRPPACFMSLHALWLCGSSQAGRPEGSALRRSHDAEHGPPESSWVCGAGAGTQLRSTRNEVAVSRAPWRLTSHADACALAGIAL